MAASRQFFQGCVVTRRARAGGEGTAHLTRNPVIGNAMDNSYRNSQRNRAGRAGHGVALRVLLGPAPEQISGRAAAKSLAAAGHQVADPPCTTTTSGLPLPADAPLGPPPLGRRTSARLSGPGPYLMVASGGGAGLVRNFSRVHGIHSGTSRHGIPYSYPDSHELPAEVSNGCGRECLTRIGDAIPMSSADVIKHDDT